MCLACMSAYQNWVVMKQREGPWASLSLALLHPVWSAPTVSSLLVGKQPSRVCLELSSALWCWLTLAKAPGSQECLLQFTVQTIWQVAALGTIPMNTHLITLSRWVCVTFWAVRRAHWPSPMWWKVVTERILGHTLESLYSMDILVPPAAFWFVLIENVFFPHTL